MGHEQLQLPALASDLICESLTFYQHATDRQSHLKTSFSASISRPRIPSLLLHSTASHKDNDNNDNNYRRKFRYHHWRSFHCFGPRRFRVFSPEAHYNPIKLPPDCLIKTILTVKWRSTQRIISHKLQNLGNQKRLTTLFTHLSARSTKGKMRII